jgi:prevent-host-death family protein
MPSMEVSVTAAKAQLIELVRRAEAGDDIVLTRYSHPAVRLVPVKKRRDWKAIKAAIEQIQASAKPTPGPCAARSQDFLYNEYGLPK